MSESVRAEVEIVVLVPVRVKAIMVLDPDAVEREPVEAYLNGKGVIEDVQDIEIHEETVPDTYGGDLGEYAGMLVRGDFTEAHADFKVQSVTVIEERTQA